MDDALPAPLPDLALGELGTKIGLRFEKVERDEVRASIPVEGNRQPYGLLHGGASAALAEQVGSTAAFLYAPEGTVPVGIELSCAHHRSATSGTVTAVCRPANVGRTLATFDLKITDDQGRLICTARLTCLFRALPA